MGGRFHWSLMIYWLCAAAFCGSDCPGCCTRLWGMRWVRFQWWLCKTGGGDSFLPWMLWAVSKRTAFDGLQCSSCWAQWAFWSLHPTQGEEVCWERQDIINCLDQEGDAVWFCLPEHRLSDFPIHGLLPPCPCSRSLKPAALLDLPSSTVAFTSSWICLRFSFPLHFLCKDVGNNPKAALPWATTPTRSLWGSRDSASTQQPGHSTSFRSSPPLLREPPLGLFSLCTASPLSVLPWIPLSKTPGATVDEVYW